MKKIVNEKGKLFGIINLVDLIIVVAVLAACLVIVSKLFGNVTSTTEKITVKMDIVGCNDVQLAEIQTQVGQQLVSGTGYDSGCYITEVTYEPYVVYTTDDNGEMHKTTHPEYHTVHVVVTADITISAVSPISKIGTQEVRAGRTFTLKTRYVEHNAVIRDVIYES